MSGGIYSVACSFGLFISGFWSWQPYIIFSISVCPSFFLMFHRYIFSPYSLFTSQKVSVVISSISQDITEKYHWNTIFFVRQKVEGCHWYFSVKRSVVFALLLTTLTLQSETGSAQWYPINLYNSERQRKKWKCNILKNTSIVKYINTYCLEYAYKYWNIYVSFSRSE